MGTKIVENKKSDSDSTNSDNWLKSIDANNDVKLNARDLLFFLDYFGFSNKCKNDKCINKGHIPEDYYLEKGILQYDITEVYFNKKLYKKTYTLKITKEGQNYFMPFVLALIDLKRIVNTLKNPK